MAFDLVGIKNEKVEKHDVKCVHSDQMQFLSKEFRNAFYWNCHKKNQFSDNYDELFVQAFLTTECNFKTIFKINTKCDVELCIFRCTNLVRSIQHLTD